MGSIAICLVGLLTLSTICTLALDRLWRSLQGVNYSGIPDLQAWVRSMWRSIYFISLSFGYWYFLRTVMLEKQSAEAEAGLVKATNAYLLSRISPHLLFNSLNLIASSIDTDPQKAKASIDLLADTMRYALTEPGPDGKVPLSDELTQIHQYIDLHQLRFSNRLHIVFREEVTVATDTIRIPPMLLLTLVENVFAHGELGDSAFPARVLASVTEDGLSFSIRNRKRSVRHKGHRIGIANVQSRLSTLYPENAFELSIEDSPEDYQLSLKLKRT